MTETSDLKGPAPADRSLLTRAPHLISLAVAVVLVAAALVVGHMYAERVENNYIHILAAKQFLLKNQGSALQRAAFRQTDLLPFYGSSELLALHNPYHASNVFQDYPTGFTVFPVAGLQTTTLIMVQALAAIGPDLRGKKVALSLTPYWYYQINDYAQEYAGNFSPLHAGRLLFNANLSFALRGRAARRMQRYSASLENRPLLKFAVNRLANDSPLNRLLYYAVRPFGQLQNWILSLQDHWQSLAYVRQQHLEPASPHRPAPLDWPTVIARAEREFERHNDNNQFGFDNQWYDRQFDRTIRRNTFTDASLRAGLEASEEWTDLELLLSVAKELGAQPLVLCAPAPGLFYHYLGISDELRQAYYQKFEHVVRAHGVPVLAFVNHDRDKSFIVDPAAHLSEKGWAYYDRALDGFYHGTLK